MPSPYVQAEVAAEDGDLAASAIIRSAALGALRFVFVLEWHWRAGARGGARRLLRDAIAVARAAGAHGVAALAMPGTVQRRMLRGLGFIPLPSAMLPRTSVASVRLDAEDQHAAAASWIARSNWYLTCGDGFLL